MEKLKIKLIDADENTVLTHIASFTTEMTDAECMVMGLEAFADQLRKKFNLNRKTQEKRPVTLAKSVELTSSNVSKASYTDEGDLLIEFKNGEEYLYHNVPVETYYDLVEAKSAGKFLNEAIKGTYKYTKVEE